MKLQDVLSADQVRQLKETVTSGKLPDPKPIGPPIYNHRALAWLVMLDNGRTASFDTQGEAQEYCDGATK